MIILTEQYGYGSKKSIDNIDKFLEKLAGGTYQKPSKKDKNNYCYKITCLGSNELSYSFETSYFVGVDWVVENKLSIYVQPKLNDDKTEINYTQMLFDIMKEPDNFSHLDGLCEIEFEKSLIEIEQKQDLLTPLLLIQYVHVLKRIVRKGLKKSYYSVVQNLNSKIKGRILINQTIKKNHANNKKTFNYCEYSEFGINSIENKILKKALSFSISALQNLKGVDASALKSIINYIQPAFEHVDVDVNIADIKGIKPNKLYAEYEQALKLANLILKRYGYNISTINSTKVKTPPFWIDMSKLFELYVFSKLKERFPMQNEVFYHKKYNYLEPDYIIKSMDSKYKMVLDAKYKPRYKDEHVTKDDIRQLSGYARLEKIYEELECEKTTILDCLIIYANQNAGRKDFLNDNFTFEKEEHYVGFYKIGIELPYH